MSEGAMLSERLKALIDDGLSFGACVAAFADRRTETDLAYVRAADSRDENVEVDDNAIVSGSEDDGDYVMAWLWVTNEAAGLPSIYDEDGNRREEDGS